MANWGSESDFTDVVQSKQEEAELACKPTSWHSSLWLYVCDWGPHCSSSAIWACSRDGGGGGGNGAQGRGWGGSEWGEEKRRITQATYMCVSYFQTIQNVCSLKHGSTIVSLPLVPEKWSGFGLLNMPTASDGPDKVLPIFSDHPPPPTKENWVVRSVVKFVFSFLFNPDKTITLN